MTCPKPFAPTRLVACGLNPLSCWIRRINRSGSMPARRASSLAISRSADFVYSTIELPLFSTHNLQQPRVSVKVALQIGLHGLLRELRSRQSLLRCRRHLHSAEQPQQPSIKCHETIDIRRAAGAVRAKLKEVPRCAVRLRLPQTQSRLDLHRHPAARRRLAPQINAINVDMRGHNAVLLKNSGRLKLSSAANCLLR